MARSIFGLNRYDEEPVGYGSLKTGLAPGVSVPQIKPTVAPSSTGGSTLTPQPGTSGSSMFPYTPMYGSTGSAGSIGGFGAGGGGSTTSHTGFGPIDDQGMNTLIADQLKGILGGETRYSDEVVAGMKGGLKSATSGQAKANIDAIEQDAARRGMFRSGVTGKRTDTVRRAAASDYTKGVQGIQQEKATADFQDKIMALDRGQKWLDSMRDYSLRSDLTELQKEQLHANIALGYANLEAERERLSKTLGAQWDLANLARQPVPWRDLVDFQMPDGSRTQMPSWLLPYLFGGA
jgi:hypothetical protein